MKLTATVDNIRSARTSQTGKEQAVVKVKDIWHNVDGVYLNNEEGWALDEELVLIVLTKEQAADIYMRLGQAGDLLDKPLIPLRDQLRPDEPPPFLRCTAAMILNVQNDRARCSLLQGHSEPHAYVSEPSNESILVPSTPPRRKEFELRDRHRA